MKCPKCDYLGFDTGPRCRNCGYDFSLTPTPAGDVDLRLPLADPPAATEAWFDQVDRALGQWSPAVQVAGEVPITPAVPPAAVTSEDAPLRSPARTAPFPAPVAARRREGGGPALRPLPLLTPPTDDETDDTPLVTLPATPRPPLAVRKTPDIPRLRPVRGVGSRTPAEPVLQFTDDPVVAAAPASDPAPDTADADISVPERPLRRRAGARAPHTRPAQGADGAAPGVWVRAQALAIDHAILTGIDLLVIYFTARMAALAPAEWTLLPVVPLLTFLLLIKVAYFAAFTALGGQTIGKMALSLRVVVDDEGRLDAACAIRRTLAGLLSALLLGLGFVPALFDVRRRTLHDRLSGTRVVALRPA